ncbi:MAG TPA: glycosyltransferase family 2 protein [Oculatellaceae cyanobacterium]
MKPEVSVIIAAYNTEAYIAQAIESVLGQSLNNIEVIVVDDASSDSTAEVARSFTDKRLKVLVNKQNLGVSGARNRALREAQGKWVAVLDSDDWYAPERLEKLLQIAEANKADMIADDLHLIRDGETQPWSTLIRESGESIDKIMVIDPVYFVKTDKYGEQGLRLGISKPIFRRDYLVQNAITYDEQLNIAEDFWLNMECLVRGAVFFLVPQPYYFYRSRSGSLVFSKRVQRLEKDCKKIIDFIATQDLKVKNPQLAGVLYENLEIFKGYLSYYRVVEPIKAKQWSKALIELARNSGFWVYFLKRIPGIITRRIEYYVLKNKNAYGIFSSKKI